MRACVLHGRGGTHGLALSHSHDGFAPATGSGASSEGSSSVALSPDLTQWCEAILRSRWLYGLRVWAVCACMCVCACVCVCVCAALSVG